MPKIGAMDIVTSQPCPKCGCEGWLVDSDGEGKFWLLCLGAKNDPGCVETKDLPECFEIKED